MQLPIEIISEIANQNPFRSFMRYLNKETKKYWEDRSVYLDPRISEARKSDKKIDLVYICADAPNCKYHVETVLEARFLSLNANIFIMHNPMNLYYELKKSNRLEVIDLLGKYIYQTHLLHFPEKIKIQNYKCYLRDRDRNLILTRFPDFIDLFDSYIEESKTIRFHIHGERFWSLLIISNSNGEQKIVAESPGNNTIDDKIIFGLDLSILLGLYSSKKHEFSEIINIARNCEQQKFAN